MVTWRTQFRVGSRPSQYFDWPKKGKTIRTGHAGNGAFWQGTLVAEIPWEFGVILKDYPIFV